ncbi:hypothetical protein [Sphingosinicella terrae]|uniref:hypothetical protein n=1 Tax=Sphingosinicella terrae TaxID=2172047 RepID=UPI000E0DFFEA|nr:hypothetical protein [Sphingosinicella terrae]
MDWLLLAGSLGGVLALAGIAWLLGLGGAEIGDADEARRHAEEALAGFTAAEAFVSADRRAALVLGAENAAALVKVHGAQIAVRRLDRLAVEPVQGGVRIGSGDRLFGDLALALPPEARDRLLTLV